MFKVAIFALWFNGLVQAALSAAVFWFFWTYMLIGEKYFNFFPDQYMHPSIIDCIGIFVILTMVFGLIAKLVSKR